MYGTPNWTTLDDNLYTRLVQAICVAYPPPDQENLSNAPLDGKNGLDYQVNSVIFSKRKPEVVHWLGYC